MLEEFRQAPLCLEIDLDTYEDDWRHVARFRGRSGWLIAARATLQSETEVFRTVVAAACDEWENPIPSFQAMHLLECVWMKVHPCFDEPPAILQDLLCEEEGQVYARWQRETNAALQQHLIDSEAKIAAVDRAARLASDSRLRQIADLRRRRRFLGLTDEAKSIFDSIIVDLEAENDRAFQAAREEVGELRRAAEQAEEALWGREDVLIEVQPPCILFWSAPKPTGFLPRERGWAAVPTREAVDLRLRHQVPPRIQALERELDEARRQRWGRSSETLIEKEIRQLRKLLKGV